MRIGIVSDRRRETEVLLQAVAMTPEHRVIWTASSGAGALDLCAKETPNLILMGLLTGMDCVEATRRIMVSSPCAIVVVTENVYDDAARVFEAMGHGALEVVEMPASETGNLQAGIAPLLAKVDLVSRLIGEKSAARCALSSARPVLTTPGQPPLIAIGASAGGPAALAVVLGGLPRDLPAAIVVIQHVEAQFAEGMADWLSEQSALPVTVAREGECPAVGRVLLAGTSDHLALKAAHRLGYTPEPQDYIYRPSVDVFFDSVSRLWRGDVVGVLLTGMGNDGALGLKALRDRCHYTIAQDRATSAVYGMPKAAAALNAAVDILPIARIPERLIEVLVSRHVSRS